jgi:sacsin
MVILATKIAPQHPANIHLLTDIKATYDWLSNNIEEASPHLRNERHKPIWLNVGNPESADEPWTWRPAEQLVFDMSFDGEGGRYDVKDCLFKYKSLLLATGAKAFVHARISESSESVTKSSHIERLRDGWNKLRERGSFFDIQFNVAGESIPAHKGMLAAVVEHFMTALTGDYLETTMAPSSDGYPVYPLHADVSAFSVRSVVGASTQHATGFSRSRCSRLCLYRIFPCSCLQQCGRSVLLSCWILIANLPNHRGGPSTFRIA